jgi:hypothetical protein
MLKMASPSVQQDRCDHHATKSSTKIAKVMVVVDLASVNRLRVKETKGGGAAMSYTTMLKGTVHLSHLNNLVKAKTRERQVPIDLYLQSDNNTLKGLT